MVWDLADLDRSRGAIPTGQSGNAASGHWADQTDVWASGELREMPFTEDAIAAATVSKLNLKP